MAGKETQREYGDYQTPVFFAEEVLKCLKNNLQIEADVIVEPTCGQGNFLVGAHKIYPKSELYGIEINPEYVEIARNSTPSATIFQGDLFEFDFDLIPNGKHRNMLVVGNPPWANNSTLSSLRSGNLPLKTNFKGLKGIDAITGSANFDICEYMLLDIIRQFASTETVIALLCKTIVSRNVIKEMRRTEVPYMWAKTFNFDSKKIFNISADACLFVIKLGKKKTDEEMCQVYNFDNPDKEISRFGFNNGRFYSELDSAAVDLDGNCCFEWRQGIKHDCSKVMELKNQNGSLYNGMNHLVDIENDFLYPLIKSSKVKSCIITESQVSVIVTQKKVRENTEYISETAPKTWKYLSDNLESFEKRKSSIYKGAPPFSMFGIGDYSFSKYKVGISGFYKKPIFSLLYGEKPIMMDDTCYFISFLSFDLAYVAMLILNSDLVQMFLQSIAFLDSKRPYTKKVLERIDFGKAVDKLNYDELKKTEQNLSLNSHLTEQMLEAFKQSIS